MSAPLRVLIVEDSEDDVRLLLHELRRGGFEPLHERVETAKALRAALARQDWDIVISDYAIPSFSGLKAFEIVRASGIDLPFIFVSGTIGEDVAVATMKAGAHDYLLKGNLKQLVPAIQRELLEAAHRKERNRAEEVLGRSEEQLRFLLESTAASINGRDLQGDFTSLSQLRALAARLEKVREEERARVAREIHDELGQVLTAIKMDLTSLFRNLFDNPKPLPSKAQSVLGLIDEAIQKVRRITTELRPGVLDRFGLAAAIEWAAEEFQTRTGIICQLDLPEEDLASERESSTAIFRIFQETLTNAARHSAATQLSVRLIRADNKVVLEVRDNGKGIEPKHIVSPGSLGILGMRERALILQGDLEVFGSPGKGTTVTVRIPVKPQPELE
jgi:signal transduction histidine kinase